MTPDAGLAPAWAPTIPRRPASRPGLLGRWFAATPHDLYFGGLLLAVAAYALTGKGFAYAGIPPLFPGEIMLLAGLATFVYPRASLAVFASPPSVLLVLTMGWVVIRTLPFLGTNAIDALRDSVVVLYGLFAFVIANLILEKPARIDRAVQWAGRFFSFFGASIFLIYTLAKHFESVIPHWPSSETPLVALRAGEAAVHVGGAAVFALLGLKRSTLPWVIMMILAFVAVSTQSRSGLLAIVVPFMMAAILAGRLKVPVMLTLAALPIVGILYIGDVAVLESAHRQVKITQLVDNMASIFIKTDSSDNTLDDTKTWRLHWWSKIVGYTVHGDAFWMGKGFGVNLAEQDGFAGKDKSGPPLRSPHSVHMTMLARTGVPGLLLWCLLHLSWLAMMLRRMVLARLRGDVPWANLLLFITCYATGIMIDSSFDVAIEGPMVGIPFWVVFGTGIGLSLTYDALSRDRNAALAAQARRPCH